MNEDGAYPLEVKTVSVIVTTKNNASTIGACLKSIQDQDIDRLELIVVDNDSTDETHAIAAGYTTQILRRGPERSAQRNYGVLEAGGECVMIVDADMILSPTIISECMAMVGDRYEAIIIPEESYGEGFWARCRVLERSFYNNEQPRFFTRALFESIKGYDETAAGEDFSLHARVTEQTSIARINAVIRRNEGPVSFASIKATYRDEYVKPGLGQLLSAYRLFLSHPTKLFKRPTIGVGLLTMKTVEYGAARFSR